MSLKEYEKKRDFARTAEPPAKRAPREAHREHLRFVVQKHDASRLHYDLRLEMDGVLKSWAVPKGFPWGKGERHLAVHVEDHPMAYADFEGINPRGEYGGGTVMVWDTGTYDVIDDEPVRALDGGKLHLRFEGSKLNGEWTLVRTRSEGDKEHWLLMKTGESTPPISVRRDDRSVLTRRTMRQIAQQKTATWRSNRTEPSTAAGQASSAKDKSAARRGAEPVASSKRQSHESDRAKIGFVEPMKARLVDAPPSHGDWIYELKWDGYRAIGIKEGRRVAIYSRNAKSLTEEFPEVRDALLQLPVERAILDGEIVALGPNGHPAFQLLQARNTGRKRPPIYFYLFDLLHLDGKDLLKTPLCERKEKLESLIGSGGDPLRYSAWLDGDVQDILREVCSRGLEGVIGKRRDSVYEPGKRTGAWVKIKCGAEQEFVIGGYTEPKGSRTHFGALHVGYYKEGALCYAGKAGTGFDRALLEAVWKKLARITIPENPFSDVPKRVGGKWIRNMSPAVMRESHWVRPELVCQVRFAEWTEDGALREPVFLGLREDKEPGEVVRE